jgi:CAAX prenyl protease-like protein
VPVMEELFWRSFLIRYVIASDFEKVPIGKFTWSSFLITSILFGSEHHFFLAGVMAGVAYNLLLNCTRSIALCIFSHAVTNLALGIYVLASNKWYFW